MSQRRLNHINPGMYPIWIKAGLSCFLLLCLLTGCDDTPALSHPLLGKYQFTPAPITVGKLTFADLQFPTNANPLFASTSADFTINAALWAQPVFYDEHFHVHPDQLTEVPLPENGDVRDQGKTILMHLRHDLHWSDGQPLLASDFQYWWRLNQDTVTGATITSGYDQIASIEIPDQFTVVLHMKRSFGPYLFYLPYAAPEHAWGKLAPIELQNIRSVYQAPTVTSGPYKLQNVLDGQRYTLAPNSYYTSTTFHGPFVTQFVYQAYTDVATLRQAVLQQQVDISQGYTEADLPDFTHLPDSIHVLTPLAAAYEHLDFNNAQPLFQDIKVRRAIQMAIDTCALLKTVLHTHDCSRRIAQVEPPPSLFADPTIHLSKYDPGQARKLLAEAGWQPDTRGMLMKAGQPFTIRLVATRDDPIRAALVQHIQQDLQAIGIQVQPAFYSLNTFFAGYTKGGILATGAYDMALFTYVDSPEPGDEYAVFHSSQIPNSDQPELGNYGRITDPIIDQALTQGQESVVFADRVTAYQHFLQRLAEQVYLIPLYVDVNIMTVREGVHNVLPHPSQSANTWNAADWWTS